MNKIWKISLGLSLALACTAATADEKALQKCKALKQDLSKLEALRRYGGSKKKMDGWKRSMHDRQDEYSKLYCRQYRFELNK